MNLRSPPVIKRPLWRTMLAILAGNLIYLLIEPHLPQPIQHQLYQFDIGLILDFAICVACYVLLRYFV